MLIHCFKKRSALRGWKPNSGKLIVDPYKKRYVNSFEIDESDFASATSEFLLVDLNHDDYEQDKNDILTGYYFSFSFD